MNINKFFSIFVIFLFFLSCSKKIETDEALKERSLDLQMIEAYEQGISALKSGDVLFAAKKFNEAEILYPQSIWAPRSALMAAYAYYLQDYYGDAVAELERFIKVYPRHENLDYAYFLLATAHYEQIVNEKKDLGSLLDAKKGSFTTTAIVERIFLDIKESPFGADFINGRSIDEESGEPNVFLVDLRDYNLKIAANLLGQKVTLEKRKNGFRLRPLKLQPKETIKFLNQLNDEETIASTKVQDNESGEYKNDSEMGMPKILEGNISDSQEFVENLIITLSEQSHKLGLPMALAVCIPNLHFKK